MKSEKFLSFLSNLERVFLIFGYIFALYYIYSLAAPMVAKVFGVVLATVFIIIYVRQIFRNSKSSIGELETSINEKNTRSSRLLALDSSVVKGIAIVSLLSCLCLILITSNEVLTDQISRYFPLKLLGIVFLYLVFKESLRRLIERPLK